MPYKPKHCCQCGEKIDRENWKPWTSRRFCELCDTEFGIYDKLRAFVVGISLLFGLYGIGSYFQKPEKQLNVASTQLIASNSSGMVNSPKTVAQVSNAGGVQTIAQTNNSNAAVKTQKSPIAVDSKIKQAALQTIEPTEKVYFCGAATKKGTMCSRRVKNAGRCWQHEGQPALMPQEKLIAAQ